jgi:hypothetical protein
VLQTCGKGVDELLSACATGVQHLLYPVLPTVSGDEPRVVTIVCFNRSKTRMGMAIHMICIK